jgi:sister chromatid cohesion protein DCC1
MTPAYVTQILDFIITAATANSLPLDALTLVSILTSFGDEERPECIQTILRTFSKSPTERILLLTRANVAYSLDHSKIIQWYGIRTLADINHKMPTALFMERWQSVIPAAIDKATPSTTLLKGNCYHPTPTTIHYLPASELSTVPEQRFGQLFGIKEKWSMEEIMPFLEGCVESGEGWEKKAERECQKWARVRQGLVMKR